MNDVKTKAQVKEILQNDYEKERLLHLAYHGIGSAQFILGIIYQSGEYGVPKIQTKAVEWFQKAAEQDHADAQYHLGLFYYMDGMNKKPDAFLEAFNWFQKSAVQGHADAQDYLGLMYRWGRDIPQNLPEAFRWFQKSANQGNKHGQFHLGEMYAYGLGTPEDNIEALCWLDLGKLGCISKGDVERWQEKILTVTNRMKKEEIDEAMSRSFEFVKQCHYKMFEQ